MRNRAKCKLCKYIIESFVEGDYVKCNCGEIAISGGNLTYDCFANDLTNIIRIDDDGNEIIPKIIEKNKMDIEEETRDLLPINDLFHAAVQERNENTEISREDLLDSLDHMIQNLDNLPEHAKQLPINHYDFGSLLLLLSAILRAKE